MMEVPLIVLGVLAIVGGYVNLPAMLGGDHELSTFLDPVFHAGGGHETGHVTLEVVLTLASTVVGLAGIFTAYHLYLGKRETAERLGRGWSRFYGLLREGYYFDRAYDFLWVRPFNRLGELLWKGIDLGTIDGSIHRLVRAWVRGSAFTWKNLDMAAIDGFVDGVAAFVLSCGRSFGFLQRGLVRDYAASMVIGIVIFIGYFLVTRIL
jgi:NADH-quinone oxidoreductase subunit L